MYMCVWGGSVCGCVGVGVCVCVSLCCDGVNLKVFCRCNLHRARYVSPMCS